MNDVRRQTLHHARELPGGGQIHLGPGRNRDEIEPLLRAPAELAVGMGDEGRAMSDLAQADDGQQHLVLAAAPRPRRVDVQREHRIRSGSGFSERLANSGTVSV